jgi:hypothetical protein
MIVAEMRSADMPMEILGLEVKGEDTRAAEKVRVHQL